ncbi:MAG: PAS domain-containing protein [Thermodesulfobacteriota bacterium]
MQAKKWDEILVGEHEMIERAMDILGRELNKLPGNTQDVFVIKRAIDFLLVFGDGIHNQKEETVLFPLMVRRNIPESGPIRVMLSEHEAERNLLKELLAASAGLSKAAAEDRTGFMKRGAQYLEIRSNHIWKENDVLFKLGLQVFSEKDGRDLVDQFRQINIQAYGATAQQKFLQMLEEVEKGGKARKSLIHNLSMEQIDAIMETLPVEVTFVDADDTVAYFNRLDREKIFVRSRSVVGRKVEKCHPEKSVDTVKRIVNGFKNGSMDKAEFWIDLMGDKVLIRYFPVRGAAGEYLGVLEVTQKIGEIQKLSGQKRLLD